MRQVACSFYLLMSRQLPTYSCRIILTHANDEVRELNSMARSKMRAAGQLGADATIKAARGERQLRSILRALRRVAPDIARPVPEEDAVFHSVGDRGGAGGARRLRDPRGAESVNARSGLR